MENRLHFPTNYACFYVPVGTIVGNNDPPTSERESESCSLQLIYRGSSFQRLRN